MPIPAAPATGRHDENISADPPTLDGNVPPLPERQGTWSKEEVEAPAARPALRP
jgi:hypothetical protein